ncbi:mitogen-activated protein kinase kinase kinase 18-like [Nicotiana tabacum]|uniref:Mitogen-activated protein kinase kinase kinase 18-like n=2 Tax=Nicotiana TaxID=4085 RepID=A0A1S4D710_TOBAC|nr:PREDICTED: mitogen-activated protein kinase kinase kinase NPK1-like [Nicotiana sylvestris]XP_016509133.1 PREDICTED: mitogen-activated protein kinase kinase kinase NPK1-like [Nicotiana tabacum]
MAGICKCSCPQPTKWLKGKVIGSGSFGSIHLAMDKATGGLFVVKSADSEAGLKCLENEVKILENLGSPHIVKFIGKDFSFEANGKRKLSLFIEYMTGGSLADVAEKFGGFLDEEVISLYTKGILKGLKYIHENGIVHCDLKCKNILLGTSGEVKLADFGCAKRIKDNKVNGSPKSLSKSIGGTPLWMAPEILRNEELDFAADIWSLGCTIIEMATGKPPWGGDICTNPLAAVLKIACSNDMPQFPAHFSDDGLDFLAKCLERDTKKRWRVEQLLDHPFVSKMSKGKNLEKIDASTPASVLDARFFSEMDFLDESSDEDDSMSGNPFSMRCDHEFWISRRGGKNDLESSESWITVRN